MTVQLEWPPEVVDRLTAEAQQKGLSLDAYVLEVIQKSGANGTSVDDAEKWQQREEAVASIRELRKGNLSRPGPDHSRPN